MNSEQVLQIIWFEVPPVLHLADDDLGLSPVAEDHEDIEFAVACSPVTVLTLRSSQLYPELMWTAFVEKSTRPYGRGGRDERGCFEDAVLTDVRREPKSPR